MKKYVFVKNSSFEKALEIASRVVDYLNDGENGIVRLLVFKEMDETLIYDYDLWEMIKYYCDSPKNADFYYAWNECADDIMNCIEKEIEL